ncbi:MAG: outer membrane beta-barrel protein [Candidatus Aureabacteria bacterium]|nr:outer membrane beta-barrel protein [Candidatus Auribacterota bacterium]
MLTNIKKETLRFVATCAFTGLFLLVCSSVVNAEFTDQQDLPDMRKFTTSWRTSAGDLPDREGLEVEPFLFHGAFKVKETFDTNIYLSNEDEESDMITLLNPSVGVEIPVYDHKLTAEYSLGAYFFARHDEDHIDHLVRGLAEINLTDFKITVSDIYRRFTHRSGSEDTNRIRQQHNSLRAGISAEFDQLDFDVGYTFEIDDYLRDLSIFQTLNYKDKDRYSNIMDAKLAYRFLPKTSILFENYLGFVNYQSKLSSDSWYTENLIGLRGELDKDFTVDVKGGFRYQNYKKSRLTVDDDFASFVARGDIDYAITDNDIISLGLERSIYESAYKNMNYYNVNFVSLNYNHRFRKKITGTLFGAYQYNRYPSETTEGSKTGERYDHLFGGGGSLRYDMRKWVSFEGRYEYQQRDSRFPVFDFKDHLLSLRGTVGF